MPLTIASASITGINTDFGTDIPGFYTNDPSAGVSGTVTLTGTDDGAEPVVGVWAVNGSTSIYLGDATISGAGSGPYAWSFPTAAASLPEGTWTLEAFASSSTDNAAPVATPLATQSLTVDLTAPTESSNAFNSPIKVHDDGGPRGPGSFLFGTSYGDAITVGDNNDDVLTVTIDVGAGSTFGVTDQGQSGGTVSGQSITITGTASFVNQTLQNAVYHTSLKDNVSGNVNDTITITTVDSAGNYVEKQISVDVVCFMAGTMIRTPHGEAAVETLQRGDLVLTADGQAKPVVWLGRQTVSRLFANPVRVLPIRIKAGALGEHVPSRDLRVSPDHALLVGDILVHAGALVNGTSITRETDVPERFAYYHVELDDHSLILAEGAAAETFVDNVERMRFDNWDEHEALYPDGKPVDELPYPRAKAQRQVPYSLRAMLAERAAAFGAVAEATA